MTEEKKTRNGGKLDLSRTAARISVCRNLWIPWHRNCRAPPPNLLLNSDILDIFEPSRPVFALEKSIKQVNMKLFRSSTLLISFEIYITRLQFALQRPNIRLKDIITGAMLEMLPWKPVTATSSYCIVQKLIEEALEAGPYFMKVPSDPGLQNTKTELDGVEIRRIRRQISYLTPV